LTYACCNRSLGYVFSCAVICDKPQHTDRTTVYFNCFSSGDGCHSRLLQFRDQTSDAVLELAVLGGINEWVDTVVGQHQYHGEVVEPVCQGIRDWNLNFQPMFIMYQRGTYYNRREEQLKAVRRCCCWERCSCKVENEVVEPAGKIDIVADEVSQKEGNFIGGPTYDISAAYHQGRDCSVASGRSSSGTSSWRRLKSNTGVRNLFTRCATRLKGKGNVFYIAT